MPADDLLLPFQTVRSGVRGRIVRWVRWSIPSCRGMPTRSLSVTRWAKPWRWPHCSVRRSRWTASSSCRPNRRRTGFSRRGLRDARQGARLRQLRQGRPDAGRCQRTWEPGCAARQRACRDDHRSGRRYGSLPGIVALEREPLVDAAHTYFRQSEQLPTFIRLAVARHYGPSRPEGEPVWRWRAGGILIQHLSREGWQAGRGRGARCRPASR